MMGRIKMAHDWDFRGAESSLSRALELSPGNTDVLRIAAALAKAQGRLEEAIGLWRRTVEQDPLSGLADTNLGLALHCLGRFSDAESAYQKALELAPQRGGTRALLAQTLLALKRGEEALAEAAREPEEAFRLWALAVVHHVVGNGAKSDTALREFIDKYAEGGALQVAEIYGARGDVDAAFDWLERAYAQRDGGVIEMKTSTLLRSLHGDPRWGAFLKKMGLED